MENIKQLIKHLSNSYHSVCTNSSDSDIFGNSPKDGFTMYFYKYYIGKYKRLFVIDNTTFYVNDDITKPGHIKISNKFLDKDESQEFWSDNINLNRFENMKAFW